MQRSQAFYRKSQFLYPWIVFSCNGYVTKWIFGAENNGNLSQPELQIWRQLGTNNYIKIGSSSVNASAMIGASLYEFIPHTPLQFQKGDIFGVYSDRTDGNRLVLFEQKENGPINLRIGPSLNSPPSTITETLYTVTNDFPLVTVEIGQYLYIQIYYFLTDIHTQSFSIEYTMTGNGGSAITSVSHSLSLLTNIVSIQFPNIMSPTQASSLPTYTEVLSKCYPFC